MNKDMKKVYRVSMECVQAMIKKGYTPEKAEDMVLEILKESLEKGLPVGGAGMVIATLRMIFLDVEPKTAAQQLVDRLVCMN
tara:strand:- start:963 stop:1208 length:246 start_codon:yes stop_codon:yes gene_type:complete